MRSQKLRELGALNMQKHNCWILKYNYENCLLWRTLVEVLINSTQQSTNRLRLSRAPVMFLAEVSQRFRKVGPPLPYLIPFPFSPLSLSLSHPIFSPVPFLLYCYPGAPPARASGSACFHGEVSANLVGKWNKKKTKKHRRQNRASSITTESLRLWCKCNKQDLDETLWFWARETRFMLDRGLEHSFRWNGPCVYGERSYGK